MVIQELLRHLVERAGSDLHLKVGAVSTLHTADTTETVNRVLEFFPPHQQRQVRLALAGTLRCIGLYRDGTVTLAEAMQAASSPHDFRIAVEQAGLPV